MGTSALKMVSLELGFDTNITILNHCLCSVEIIQAAVFATVSCSKRTHSFGQIAFFLVLGLAAMASAAALHWMGSGSTSAVEGEGSLQ